MAMDDSEERPTLEDLMVVPLEASVTDVTRIQLLRASPAGKRVGVLGLGIVGRAMCAYLARRGAQVIAVDKRADVGDVSALRAMGCTLHTGVSDTDASGLPLLPFLDALALSPGADPRQPLVMALRQSGVPVLGELELAGPLPCKVIGITGTNGKSTTTTLIGALLRGLGQKVFTGGNLGDPILAWLDRDEPTDVAVLELSSFQLETAYCFRPDVAVVLNVTPDHLDRYPDFEAYAFTKERIVSQLGRNQVAVLCADDARVTAMAKSTVGHVLWFSTQHTHLRGDSAWWDPQADQLQSGGVVECLRGFDLNHPRLLGQHNRQNALAALLAVFGLGFGQTEEERALLRKAYLAFDGLEHRLEIVREVNDVLFVNDSKATNDDAAAIGVTAAIASLKRPLILLAGGRDKGAGYRNLVRASQGHVKHVMAFGEARDPIAAAFSGCCEVTQCVSMNEALQEAVAHATPGDVVVLSPACSSFDAFNNFAERGRAFKAWVQALPTRNIHV